MVAGEGRRQGAGGDEQQQARTVGRAAIIHVQRSHGHSGVTVRALALQRPRAHGSGAAVALLVQHCAPCRRGALPGPAAPVSSAVSASAATRSALPTGPGMVHGIAVVTMTIAQRLTRACLQERRAAQACKFKQE